MNLGGSGFRNRSRVRNHSAEVIRHAENLKGGDRVFHIHEFVTVGVFENADKPAVEIHCGLLLGGYAAEFQKWAPKCFASSPDLFFVSQKEFLRDVQAAIARQLKFLSGDCLSLCALEIHTRRVARRWAHCQRSKPPFCERFFSLG
jgi:hypothetical protein